MEYRISATELARRLGDVLGRIRYRGDVFTVERNGAPVARIGPAPRESGATLREALAAWRPGGPDPELADDLARVNEADRPPANPWAS